MSSLVVWWTDRLFHRIYQAFLLRTSTAIFAGGSKEQTKRQIERRKEGRKEGKKGRKEE